MIIYLIVLKTHLFKKSKTFKINLKTNLTKNNNFKYFHSFQNIYKLANYLRLDVCIK